MSLFESEAHNKRKENDTITEPESKVKKSRFETYIPKKVSPKGRYYIKWSCITNMIDYDSPYIKNTDSYIVNHEGTLMFVSDEADEADDKEGMIAGSIKCTKIDSSQITNDHLNRFEYLDTRSDELSRVAQLMDALDGYNEIHTSNYGRENFFKQMISGSTEKKILINNVGEDWEICQGSVLYISRVTINEDFKGLGLGLFLVDQADRILNSYMSLCLLIPFPLQYDTPEFQMDADTPEFDAAKRKVEFCAAKKKVTDHWMRYTLVYRSKYE
jgi:hypothetical protein